MSRWMALAWLVVAAMFVCSTLAATVYLDKFPEKIPTHYDINGKADGFASRDQKFVPFFLFPTMTAGVILLGVVLPKVSPKQFQVDDFRKVFDFVFFLVAGLFAAMHAFFLVSAARGSLDFRWLMAAIFLFFALIGNVMGKVRSNFWMGVRTPWTLANAVVWEKTHRLTAWLYVAVGILGCIAASLGVPPTWCFGLLIGGALAPVVYSLVIYKRMEKAGQL